MALRMIEVIVPEDRLADIMAKFHEMHGENSPIWVSDAREGLVSIKTVAEMGELENITDTLASRLNLEKDFRILVWPLAATVPILEKPEEDKEEEQTEPEEEKKENGNNRLSREELYAQASDMTSFGWHYVMLVIISSVVAAIGLRQNNEIVVLAAMVIAPLLGPNVALSLATTLGRWRLARLSLTAELTGIGIAVALAFLMGLFLKVDPNSKSIVLRSFVSGDDVALALASGAAGSLSFTIGVSAALVGVMVSLALLPPLVVAGLLAGSGYYTQAIQALTLFGVNVICLNMAGVLTFLIQGIRPYVPWRSSEIQKTTWAILIGWAVLLAVITAGFLLMERFGIFSLPKAD